MFDRAQAKVTRIAALLVFGTVLVVAAAATTTSGASGAAVVPGTSSGGGTSVAQQILPPPQSQPFTPEVTATGVTLTTYSGGTVADLEFELQLRFNGGARAVITVDGEFVVLIPNAPAFVNAPFQDFVAGLPDGVPARTPLLIVVDPYPPAIQTALDDARAAWATAGSADYDMQMSVSCFCLISPDVIGLPAVDLEVRNGVIVSAVTVDGITLDPLPSLFVTVEALFDRIQDGIDSRAAQITVTYHADGYPLSVFIDGALLIADDEIGYTIHELVLR